MCSLLLCLYYVSCMDITYPIIPKMGLLSKFQNNFTKTSVGQKLKLIGRIFLKVSEFSKFKTPVSADIIFFQLDRLEHFQLLWNLSQNMASEIK